MRIDPIGNSRKKSAGLLKRPWRKPVTDSCRHCGVPTPPGKDVCQECLEANAW